MPFISEELLNFSSKGWLGIIGTGDRNTAPDNITWYEELTTNDLIVKPEQIWADYSSIPPAPNLAAAQAAAVANPTIIADYSAVASAIHLTPSPNNKVFFATSTYGDLTTRMRNWIMPQLIPRVDAGWEGFPSVGYMIKFWNGDPNAGGTEISTSVEQSGAIVGWWMNFGAGAIKVASSFTSILDPTDVWMTGFQYIGASGGSGAHSALSGLANDDHVNNFYLLGRSGGQTAYGSDQPGENLRLGSTRDATTKGTITLEDATFVENDLYSVRLFGKGYHIGAFLNRYYAIKNVGYNVVQGKTNVEEITSLDDDILGLAIADYGTNTDIYYIKHGLLFTNLVTAAASIGDKVYVNASGALTLTPTAKQVATVADVNGRIFVNIGGVGGSAATVASVYGRLAGADIDGATNLINTDISLYTSPALTYTRPATVSICNRNNAVVQVRLAHVDGAIASVASEDYILYDTDLQPYETKIVEIPGMIAADSILIRSDTVDVTFNLNGQQYTTDGLKRLGAVTVIADTDTALYSATSNIKNISIVACNKDAANSVLIRIGIIDGAIGAWGANDYIFYGELLIEKETRVYDIEASVKNTETIGVRSDDADVNFIIYGETA